MLDFAAELDKLLSEEPRASDIGEDEFSLIVGSGRALLESLDKTQAGISLQVEEIYDIVKESDDSRKELKAEKAYLSQLLGAVIRLSDIIEDFAIFTQKYEELAEGVRMMWKDAATVLGECSITRLGAEGQMLDPEIHTVHSVVPSAFPREYVEQVLRSGYSYRGTLLRKAIVVVSAGGKDFENE